MRGPIKGFVAHVASVVVALAIAGGTLYALLDAADGLPSLGSPYRVKAIVPNAVSLGSGATVKSAGLEVGKVTGIERRAGRGAQLELELYDDYAPIPRDTRVEVRLRTVVGENYVALYPGRGGAAPLPSGGALPMSRAIESVQLDEILSVLDEEGRRHARELIRGFGRGLEGRGEELNAVVEEFSGEVEAGAEVLEVLARDRERFARFFDQFGAVTRAMAERGRAIRLLARQARVTAESVAGRDDALRAMIEELPPTLAQVRGTSDLLRRVTGTSAPVLSDLASAVGSFRPVTATLLPAAREARSVFGELKGAAPHLERVFARLRRLSRPGSKAMPRIGGALCELNPLVAHLPPYSRDLGAFIASTSSFISWSDANGFGEREFGMFDESSYGGYDPRTGRTVQELLDLGAIGKTTQKGYNPYPRPNEAGSPSSGQGALGPNDVKQRYTRVKADC